MIRPALVDQDKFRWSPTRFYAHLGQGRDWVLASQVMVCWSGRSPKLQVRNQTFLTQAGLGPESSSGVRGLKSIEPVYWPGSCFESAHAWNWQGRTGTHTNVALVCTQSPTELGYAPLKDPYLFVAVVVDLHGFQVHGIHLQSLEGLDSPFHYVGEVVRVLTRGGREGCSSYSSTESQSVQKDPTKARCKKRSGTTAFFCAELNAGFSGTGLDEGMCNTHPARSPSCFGVCLRSM